ncbi:MAG: hypothetical protein R3345_09690, partial [Fulvivirga sp.]|nr:hypothetical protein [Fulvivirga sp.]
VFKKIYKQGKGQFVPFIATILGIVFTDILIGLGIGIVIAIFYILFNNFQITHLKIDEENGKGEKKKIRILLAQELTFLNKASILTTLADIPDNTIVEIDATQTRYMHYDIFEIIEDFKLGAKERNIEVTTKNLKEPIEAKAPPHIEISTHGEKGEDVKEAIH